MQSCYSSEAPQGMLVAPGVLKVQAPVTFPGASPDWCRTVALPVWLSHVGERLACVYFNRHRFLVL